MPDEGDRTLRRAQAAFVTRVRLMTRVFLILAAVVLVAGAAAAFFLMGDRTPTGPEQPIAFPHTLHAADNQIPCMYCHYTADMSASAGLPSVQVCVGCHVPGSGAMDPATAQLGFPAGSEEAEKLVDYWRRGEAIPWVRVHNLPAHARFPHDMHVTVGLDCATCHGPVEEMEVVYQFAPLTMGWCVDCHRGATELSEEEEARVRERSSFVRKIAAAADRGADLGGFQGTHPDQRASVDCMVCHY
jgi:hypothetical protein